MLWKLLGDSALALHALWVAAAVLAPLWCWRRPHWRAVHLGMLGLTLLFASTLGSCPLTWAENWLARGAGASGYRDGFISHFLASLVYWDLPKPWLDLATLLWFLACFGAYAGLWLRERRAEASVSK